MATDNGNWQGEAKVSKWMANVASLLIHFEYNFIINLGQSKEKRTISVLILIFHQQLFHSLSKTWCNHQIWEKKKKIEFLWLHRFLPSCLIKSVGHSLMLYLHKRQILSSMSTNGQTKKCHFSFTVFSLPFWTIFYCTFHWD